MDNCHGACNSCAITYVPLYDTLGPNAVEYIINHAEVPIAFVQENKIPSISSKLSLLFIIIFGPNEPMVEDEDDEDEDDGDENIDSKLVIKIS
ncbi:hypothetical protein K1719_023466 [Acacia pycnantha]|nr:hypothetical protein K1719_023466 [Acacia pycnantha]